MCVCGGGGGGGEGRDNHHLTVASPRVILFLRVFPLFVSFSFRATSYRIKDEVMNRGCIVDILN